MPRILLDQNMPVGLRAVLAEHDVTTAYEMGWGGLGNGELLAAVEAADFDVMITGDTNLKYQQNLTGRRLAIVVLDTNHWSTIRAQQDSVVEAVKAWRVGGYAEVR